MRRIVRLALRLALWLALALAMALFVVWLGLRASLPALEGEQALAGLADTVRIERDSHGVPVVRSTSRLDVARATGFVHAQDRYFQMDLTRRAAAGELAALLGPALLDTDKRLRLHRFRERARVVLAGAAEADRALLSAYSEGVNAGLASLGTRPPEYWLLRTQPEAWRPEDSLLAVYSIWIDLQGTEARREQQFDRLAAVLPAPMLDFISSADPTWEAALDGSTSTPAALPTARDYDLRELEPAWFAAAEAVPQVAQPIDFAPAEPSELVGSNNWALAGERTASGHALVANDMHLGLRVPNTWYRLRLIATAEGIDVTGVTLPGVPAVVAGSNGHVAWGFTNVHGDFQDLVIVEPLPGDPDQYQTAAGPRRFEAIVESLQVAGESPLRFEVRETLWGPVIGEDARGRPMALAWTAHQPDALNLGLMAFERAADLDEAVRIAAAAGIPAQNMVIGDASGRVGWTIAGRVPVRSGFDSRRPASWNADGVGWSGWAGRDQQPHLVDPLSGQVWTANARVVGGELQAWIGNGGYSHGARSRQIREGLSVLEAATPRDFLDIQLDVRASYIAQWQPLLLAVLERRGSEWSEAAGLVREWTGRAVVEDAGYRLLRDFEQQVSRRAFAMLVVEASNRWPDFRFRTPPGFTDVAWRLVNERPAHLLDPRHASWDDWLEAAAAAALEDSANGCRRPADCTWGQVNTALIRHPLSAAVPWLARWLDMPATPLPGDWSVPRVQAPAFGASQRFAVEPGREEHGYFHMPAGQSGHPLSRFYRAGHDAWVRGEPTPFLPGPPQYVFTLTP